MSAKKLYLIIACMVAGYFGLLLIVRTTLGWATVWDENWYMGIVQHGYRFAVGEQSAVAFFPLYPLLLKILSINGAIPTRFVAALINYAAVVALCVYAIKIANIWYKNKLTTNTQLLIPLSILVYPAAFFFAGIYVDALLTALVTMAIYFALQKNYLVAFMLAGLASATKFTGIAAVVTCLVIFVVTEKRTSNMIRSGIGYCALGISGLAIYMVYLWGTFKNPFLFFSAQGAWGRNDGFFLFELLSQLITSITNIFTAEVSRSFVAARLLSIGVALIAVVAGVYAYFKKIWWLCALLIVSLGVPLASGSFDSIMRYALVPLPAVVALLVPKIRHKRMLVVMLVLLFVVQIALYSYFIKGTVFIA